MSHKVNLVRVFTAATGNSTPITLGAAYSQLFMLPSEAGAMDDRTYTYLIVDGNNWELGKGAYTASGTTLARTTVLASRIAGTLGTTRITLTGTAQVRFIESADDMDGVRGTRAVTGTSDTLNNSDLGFVVTYSNASAVAVSLAQASVSNLFLDGWACYVKNNGAGAVTITPATSTIDGAATLVLTQNQGALIWSDGTNYQSFKFRGDLGDSATKNVGTTAGTVAAGDDSRIVAAVPLPLILPKTASYTVASGDRGKLVTFSVAQGSTASVASPAAATVGNGWSFFIENTDYGAVVFDPNGSETIDGLSTMNIFKGQSFEIVSNGTNWRTKGRQSVFTIESVSPTDLAAINFIIPDGLDAMEMEVVGAYPSTEGSNIFLQSSQDGSTYDSGTNDYVAGNIYLSAAAGPVNGSSSTSSSNIRITSVMLAAAAGGAYGSIKIGRFSSIFAITSYMQQFMQASSYFELIHTAGYRNGGTQAKSFRLIASSGNINASRLILKGNA